MRIDTHDDWIEPYLLSGWLSAVWSIKYPSSSYASEYYYATQWHRPRAVERMEWLADERAKLRLKGEL